MPVYIPGTCIHKCVKILLTCNPERDTLKICMNNFMLIPFSLANTERAFFSEYSWNSCN